MYTVPRAWRLSRLKKFFTKAPCDQAPPDPIRLFKTGCKPGCTWYSARVPRTLEPVIRL